MYCNGTQKMCGFTRCLSVYLTCPVCLWLLSVPLGSCEPVVCELGLACGVRAHMCVCVCVCDQVRFICKIPGT